MEKIISYPISAVYYLFFGALLLIFHPIQWMCLRLGGYPAHKKSVDYLNAGLVNCLRLLGTNIHFGKPYHLPNTPLIVVANHQSMYDIPPLIWYLRKHHIKFISKKQLGKGIPSISFNLRHGGSVLIDRKNSQQAIKTIANMGAYLEKNKYGVVIFPEGTRSKNGIPKKFHSGGLKALVENTPSAHVVPVSINHTWKITKYGFFPLGLGGEIVFDVHKPIKASGMPFEDLFKIVEKTIKNDIILPVS